MTIKVVVNRDTFERSISEIFIRIDSKESIEQFQQLIHRGLNCWEDAPADLKEFGDMMTHGRITQNHAKQKINSRPESNPELGTPAEIERIDAFVVKYGIDKWRELILSGESHLVIAGTWKEKPTILGIDPALPGADQAVTFIPNA